MQLAAAVALMPLLFFYCAHCSSDPQCFAMDWTTPQIPLKVSGPNLIHGSLGPPESTLQLESQSVHLFLQGS